MRKGVVFEKTDAQNSHDMTRSQVDLNHVLALLCFAVLPPQNLGANPPGVKLFINTAVEWHSERDDSAQQFDTATGQIYGPTQIIGLYETGKVALLFGYVDYDPKTRAFLFAPTEGFSVYRGKWKRIEGSHLKVEYRFALGAKLATPIGCGSYDSCYGARYKEPPAIATWSTTRRTDGSITSIEATLKNDSTPRHFVALSKLKNQREVMQILRSAERKLLEQSASSP